MFALCNRESFGFHALGRRDVVARSDGGRISSDAGGLLLRETERITGIIDQFASCFTDHRDPELIEYNVGELVAQRVYVMALGYEDLNDHDDLRHDSIEAAQDRRSGTHYVSQGVGVHVAELSVSSHFPVGLRQPCRYPPDSPTRLTGFCPAESHLCTSPSCDAPRVWEFMDNLFTKRLAPNEFLGIQSGETSCDDLFEKFPNSKGTSPSQLSDQKPRNPTARPPPYDSWHTRRIHPSWQ